MCRDPRGWANGDGWSGLGGIVRMPSPMRSRSAATSPVRHGSPPVELGPVSPELALVDPELGRAARERLPDPPRRSQPADRRMSPRSPNVPPRSSACPAVSSRLPCPHDRAAASDSVCSRPLRGSLRSVCCSRWSSVARTARPSARSRRSRSQAPSPRRRHVTHRSPPHAVKPAGDLTTPATSARPCDRSSGEDVRLARVPGCSGVRVPAVRGRRARLPSARGRSPARAPRSLAAGRTPPRASAWELPLVCVDDLQAHESPVDQADGERKTRGRPSSRGDPRATRAGPTCVTS